MGKAKEDLMRMKVIEKLSKTDHLSTEDVVSMLQVSESTVRRLFRKMEEANEIIHVYGGIKANPTSGLYHYDKYYSRDIEAKRAIGRLAGDKVVNGDSIYIDCGTTTVHLASRLAERIQSGEITDISVVTNSMTNLEILSPHCLVIMTGGHYKLERKSFAGYHSERFVSQFHFTKSFIGVDGFSFDEGFATSDAEFARLSGYAAVISDQAFVLMDSSKIGKKSFIVYDKVENIHQIITDSRIKKDDMERFNATGIKLLVADIQKGE